MLNITEKKLENSTVELTIDVPVNLVEEAYRRAFEKIRNNVTIDGFRKGKAPISLIEARFRKEADREAAEMLAKDMSLEAIKEKNLSPITFPRFSFERIAREEPFTFTTIFEVAPTVDLGQYTGITVEEPTCTITEQDVADEISTMREIHAELHPKGEDAVVAKGDLVTILVRSLDGVSQDETDPGDYKQYKIIVGKSQDESALDNFIVGMKIGEQKKVDVRYPADYRISNLAGRTVAYDVVVEDLKTIELPPLNDEFAQKLGYENLDAFKEKTREELERYVADKSIGEVKSRILRAIVESSSFDIPESMVLDQMRDIYQRLEERVGYQAETIEEFALTFGLEPQSFIDRMREQARDTLKTTLAIDAIAKKESFTVDEEAYRRAVEKLAERNHMSVEDMEKIIAERDVKESIERGILIDRVMDFIYEKSHVKKAKPVTLKEFMGKNKE